MNLSAAINPRPVRSDGGNSNLFIAYFHDPKRSVFYSRNRGNIDDSTPMSAGYLLRVIDGLQFAQLIENDTGKRGAGLPDPETGRPLRSRMRATAELFEILQRHGICMRMIRSDRDFALVRLKNADKHRIALPSDSASVSRIKRMQRNLQKINLLIETSFIGLRVTDTRLAEVNRILTDDDDRLGLDFSQKRLYRVFNNSKLTHNGRFTGGWWQGLPSAVRPYLHIGGPDSHCAMPAAEADYSSMFPAIAYGLLEIGLDDTAYQLGGVSLPKPMRNVVKTTLLTMLMTSSAESTRAAVHRKLSDEEIKCNPRHERARLWKKQNLDPARRPPTLSSGWH